MGDLTLKDIQDIANGFTVAGILFLLVVALWKEWLVPGGRYKRCIEDSNRMRKAMLRAHFLSRQSVNVSNQTVEATLKLLSGGSDTNGDDEEE